MKLFFSNPGLRLRVLVNHATRSVSNDQLLAVVTSESNHRQPVNLHRLRSFDNSSKHEQNQENPGLVSTRLQWKSSLHKHMSALPEGSDLRLHPLPRLSLL